MPFLRLLRFSHPAPVDTSLLVSRGYPWSDRGDRLELDLGRADGRVVLEPEGKGWDVVHVRREWLRGRPWPTTVRRRLKTCGDVVEAMDHAEQMVRLSAVFRGGAQ